jgi:hypothetical protein
MLHNEPHKWCRPRLTHGLADVSDTGPRILCCRRIGGTAQPRQAAKNGMMTGPVSHGSARGPPNGQRRADVGASARRPTITHAAMTVMPIDATSLQLARQPARHGNSRPRATADDHESALRQLASRRSQAITASSIAVHTGGAGSPAPRRTFDRGNDEVKTCSHFTAVLLDRDTSRQS